MTAGDWLQLPALPRFSQLRFSIEVRGVYHDLPPGLSPVKMKQAIASHADIRSVVLTIHGINSRGAWQDEVARVLEPHFLCEPIRYPHYRWLGASLMCPLLMLLLLLPPLLYFGVHPIVLGGTAVVAVIVAFVVHCLARTHVRKQLDKVRTQPEVNLIAHSMGTFLACRGLARAKSVCLSKAVLVGSILPRTFPWQDLAAASPQGSSPQATQRHDAVRIRNEVGLSDGAVRMASIAAFLPPWFGYGLAGRKGFVGPSAHIVQNPYAACQDCREAGPSTIHNVTLRDVRHSDVLSANHANRFWLPFFWGFDPIQYHDIVTTCFAVARLRRDGRIHELNEALVTLYCLELQSYWLDRTEIGTFVEEQIHQTNSQRAIPIPQNEGTFKVLATFSELIVSAHEQRSKAGAPPHRVLRMNPLLAISFALQING